MKALGAIFALFLLVAGGGCGVQQSYLAQPGSIREQQLELQFAAHRFDPYPSDTMGPAVEGVRPRDYDIPPPDVYQGRWWTPWGGQADSWWSRGGF